MPSLSVSSSWLVLATTMAAAAALATMITATDEQYLMGSNYRYAEGQTISSDTNPVLVLDGAGKGTITCSNNDAVGEQADSDISSPSFPSSSSLSSSYAAQITF
jgi:hypothetical protein